MSRRVPSASRSVQSIAPARSVIANSNRSPYGKIRPLLTQRGKILQERVVSSRIRRNFRGVKRKMRNFPLRPRTNKSLPRINIKKATRILK
jgi:hypothetical protein